MELHVLYELIKMWEEKLTLTKPNDIQSINLRPVINEEVIIYGEGKICGSIEFTLERIDAYAVFNIIDIYKDYHSIEESKKREREIALCLIDYLEQFLKEDNITLIWDQIEELDLDWYEKPIE